MTVVCHAPDVPSGERTGGEHEVVPVDDDVAGKRRTKLPRHRGLSRRRNSEHHRDGTNAGRWRAVAPNLSLQARTSRPPSLGPAVGD